MEEREFQQRADRALEALRRRLLPLAEQYGFDLEGGGEMLEVLFEEPEEAKFVISVNTAARQIWISALATSFKLSWSEPAQDFVLEATGEPLWDVMRRILGQQLGTVLEA